MVAVQVREKDARKVAEFDVGCAQNLVLRAFAAVEQKQRRAALPFGRLKRDTRHVARARRGRRACSQKGDSHARIVARDDYRAPLSKIWPGRLGWSVPIPIKDCS